MRHILSVGLMSGTSMDGIDAALIRTNGMHDIERISQFSLQYDSSMRQSLKEAYDVYHEQGAKSPRYRAIEEEFTILNAFASNQLIQASGFANADIDVVGFSGQAMLHAPYRGISSQMGDGLKLANILKINVVNNMRQYDVDLKGQGAPLAPLYHWALAYNLAPIAMVNIGGIANISLVTTEIEGVRGFDVGPGNMLLDRYIKDSTSGKEYMDKDGVYSSQGSINEELLQYLKDCMHDFIRAKYPKSLDVRDLPDISGMKYDFYDTCATLAFFTAWCIIQSLLINKGLICDKIVVIGGGSANPTIIHNLSTLIEQNGMNIAIVNAADIGWSTQYIEAELFAFLAARRVIGMYTTYPFITGAVSGVSGGEIFAFN